MTTPQDLMREVTPSNSEAVEIARLRLAETIVRNGGNVNRVYLTRLFVDMVRAAQDPKAVICYA